MITMRRGVAALMMGLLTATALTGCGAATATQGVMKAEKTKGGFMGLATNADLKVTGDAAFKGAREVVVGGFTVGFSTVQHSSRKAGGGLVGNGFGGKSSVFVTLEGLDEATMQAITDKAYADFTSKLKASGYTVLDRSVLLESKEFSGVKTYNSPEVSTVGLFSTTGKTTFMAPSAFGGKMYSFADVPGYVGGLGFGSPAMGAAKLLESRKDGLRVLSVVYLLNFANADGHGGRWSMSSSVQVGQGLTVVPELSKMSMIKGYSSSFNAGTGVVGVGQPIQSDKEFVKVEDNTGAGFKASQVALNVVGVIGGVGTNQTSKYNFVTTPAKYSAAANDVLGQANSAVIGKASGLR